MRSTFVRFMTYVLLVGSIAAAVYLFGNDKGSTAVKVLVVVAGVLYLLRALGVRISGRVQTIRGPLGPMANFRPTYDIFFLPALIASAFAAALYFLG